MVVADDPGLWRSHHAFNISIPRGSDLLSRRTTTWVRFNLGGNTFAPPADLNCDGVVDVLDLLILLDDWG
jgi:hypothetical protein